MALKSPGKRAESFFYFQIESVADMNTAKGFMSALGLKRRSAFIECVKEEMSRSAIRREMKGFRWAASHKKSGDWIRVRFETEGRERFDSRGALIINYNPFKLLPLLESTKTANQRERLRRKMAVGSARKIITVSCSGRDEVMEVLRAGASLTLPLRPLFIFALRKNDYSLAGFLRKQGYEVYDRRRAGEALSGFGRADVVILNTMGELFKLLPVSNLAVVGHDRNIFEPAAAGVPALYFKRPVGISTKEKKMASMFRLYWRKNLMAKRLLDKSGGALAIRPKKFSRQMAFILSRPQPFIRGAKKAVYEFKRKVIPACRARVRKLLKTRFKPF